MNHKIYCPNCGSKNVDPDVDGFVKRWENPSRWKCEECGYQGLMPVGDSEKLEFEKSDKRKNISDAELDAKFGNKSDQYQKISLLMIFSAVIVALISQLI